VTDKRRIALACSAILALGVGACGSDDESGGGGTQAEGQASGKDRSKLSGTIRIDGSSTVQPLAEAGAELFQEEAPNVRITVGGAGTGDGFERFCRGETVISDASRAIEAEEIEACQAKSIAPVEVQVGIDGLSVVANKDLAIPNDCVTTDQLKELLEPKSKVTRYSELGSGFPDEKVSFFTPGTESGTYDYFTEEVLETDAEQRTKDVQTSADDNQIVTGISGTKGALGYVGFAFAEEHKDNLKILAVDGGDGCVKPSLETIADASYKPLSRPLFMYSSEKTAKQPEVKGFISFILEQNKQVNEASGYIALPDDQKQKAQAALDAGKTNVEAPA
jgi:phosphate transport system substrate-binding protein